MDRAHSSETIDGFRGPRRLPGARALRICGGLFAALVALAAPRIPAQRSAPNAARFTIRLDAPRQTIRNFAASDAWYCEEVGSAWPEAEREAIARLLFGQGVDGEGQPEGIGLSAWRFNIGAGSAEQGEGSRITDPRRRVSGFLKADGRYDWTAQPGQRWFLQAARGFGVSQFIGFSNSPPVQYTLNGLGHKSAKSPDSNLAPSHFQDFARFLADVVEHFRAQEHIDLHWISPFNEPQWTWDDSKQEGTPWTNPQISRLVRDLDAEYERRGLDGRILVPECAALNYGYDQAQHAAGSQVQWLFDPASQGYIGALAHVAPIFAAHSYFTDNGTQPMIDHRERLLQALQALPKSPAYWMTEYCLLGDGYRKGATHNPPSVMDCALFMARVIHADLVVADAEAWQFWTSIDPNRNPTANVRYDLVALDFEKRTFQPHKLLWALGHWSRFVRPGWRRVVVAATDAGEAPEKLPPLLVSAFVSPAIDQLAVVAVNSAETTQTLTLDLAGGAPRQGGGYRAGAWTPWLTTADATQNLHRQAAIDRPRYTLPPRSVATLTTALTRANRDY